MTPFNFDEAMESDNYETNYVPPMSVPEKERYDPLSVEYPKCVKKYNTSSIFVNRNWMQNGAAIVKMAVNEKRKNSNKSKEQISLDSLRKLEEVEADGDDKSATSRFIFSRDKIFSDENDSDDDDGKNRGVSRNLSTKNIGRRWPTM